MATHQSLSRHLAAKTRAIKALKTALSKTGDRVHNMLIIAVVVPYQSKKPMKVFCRCYTCGNYKTVDYWNLMKGDTKNCGCKRQENRGNIGERTKTHGMSGSSEHFSWNSMKARCENSNNPAWEDYGGRGIIVCQRWSSSFREFFADLGQKPSKSHSIDRIKNHLGYSCGKCDDCVSHGWPMNCRWATKTEQARNRRPRRKKKPC